MAVPVQPGPVLAAEAPGELFRFLPATTWDVTPEGDRFLVESTPIGQSGSVFATVTDWFDELRRRAPSRK